MAGFITGLVAVNGQTDFASGIGAAIQNSPTTDAEHLALANEDYKAVLANNLEKEKLGLEADKIDGADRADSRKADVAIQESVNASWLSKNVKPIIGIFVVVMTTLLFMGLCFGPDIPAGRKEIIFYVSGGLSALSTMVMGYYFGSSHANTERDKLMLAATPPASMIANTK